MISKDIYLFGLQGKRQRLSSASIVRTQFKIATNSSKPSSLFIASETEKLVDDVYPLPPDPAEASAAAYEQLKIIEAEEEAAFAQNPIDFN